MRHRQLPDVPPVEIALVGRVDQMRAVIAELRAEHLRLSGCQQQRLAARRRNRVEPHPSGDLPGKHQAVSGAPEDAVAAVEEEAETAADALGGAPDPSSLPRRGIGDPDLPGRAFAVGREGDDRIGRSAHERDPLAVRRPYRIDVVVDPRGDPLNRFGREVVDTDDAVRRPVAHESEASAIWRPAERAHSAPIDEERRGRGGSMARGHPWLTVVEEDYDIAFGRRRRHRAVANPARRAAVERDRPDSPGLGAARKAQRVDRDLCIPCHAAACIKERFTVTIPYEVRDDLAIIGRVGRESSGGIAAVRSGLRDPDIARAALVVDPGYDAVDRGSGEIVGEGCARDLRDAERARRMIRRRHRTRRGHDRERTHRNRLDHFQAHPLWLLATPAGSIS